MLDLLEGLNACGATIIVITHDHAVAARMRRRIEVLDGRIITDTGPGRGPGLAGAGGPIMTITSGPAAPAPARLRPGDLAGLASVGLRTRKLRAALSALGIAIGVAAIVAVLGLASSSQAGLLAEIAQLGTNLLTVTNGTDYQRPARRAARRRAGDGRPAGRRHRRPVHRHRQRRVYRSPLIPSIDTDGLSVAAASLGLPAVAGTSVARGSYLNAATAREPVAVLGAEAAQLMGIDRIWPGERIWVGGQWFYVVGILNPATLAPQIDTSVLVGFPAARATSASTGTRPSFTSAPSTPRPPPPGSTTCSPRRPTRRTRTRSTSPSRRKP